MFVAVQQRYTFFSFILDSYYLGPSKNINRCRQLVKNTMSNIENSAPDGGTDSKDTTNKTELTDDDPCSRSLNNNNFRRVRSAENVSSVRSFRSSTPTNDPAVYYNWAPVYSTEQGNYHWNNMTGYPVLNPAHPWYPINYAHSSGGFVNNFQVSNPVPIPVPDPCYPINYAHSSGGFANRFQGNNFFHGVVPTHNPAQPPLLSSRSVDNVQKRFCVRGNISEEHLPRDGGGVHPKILKVLAKRYWEDVGKRKTSSKPTVEFVLMSYNVLAQALINEHLYLYKNHNPRSLQWERRWKVLFDEITKLMPDILCLQEVQATHLTDFYSRLESLGYKGIFKKRTGIRCDGCAIYYKTDKFNLVEYETVEFYQPNVGILNRDNIAIIAKFSPKISPETEFIVATTHLLYNPKRQDVRLAQTQLLLTEVERLSFQCKSGSGRPCYLPVIVTGDFNSKPDSAVYELITKGILRYDNLSARILDNSKSHCHGNTLVPPDLEITDKCQHARLVQQRHKTNIVSRRDEAALIKLHNSDKSISKISTEFIDSGSLYSTGTLSHLFAFKSVYNHGDPDNVEGTTFQNEWVTVDYIFYSGRKRNEDIKDHKLKLISRFRLPRKSELGAIKIPNSALGSDHLSLIAKFKLKI